MEIILIEIGVMDEKFHFIIHPYVTIMFGAVVDDLTHFRFMCHCPDIKIIRFMDHFETGLGAGKFIFPLTACHCCEGGDFFRFFPVGFIKNSIQYDFSAYGKCGNGGAAFFIFLKEIFPLLFKIETVFCNMGGCTGIKNDCTFSGGKKGTQFIMYFRVFQQDPRIRTGIAPAHTSFRFLFCFQKKGTICLHAFFPGIPVIQGSRFIQFLFPGTVHIPEKAAGNIYASPHLVPGVSGVHPVGIMSFAVCSVRRVVADHHPVHIHLFHVDDISRHDIFKGLVFYSHPVLHLFPGAFFIGIFLPDFEILQIDFIADTFGVGKQMPVTAGVIGKHDGETGIRLYISFGGILKILICPAPEVCIRVFFENRSGKSIEKCPVSCGDHLFFFFCGGIEFAADFTLAPDRVVIISDHKEAGGIFPHLFRRKEQVASHQVVKSFMGEAGIVLSESAELPFAVDDGEIFRMFLLEFLKIFPSLNPCTADPGTGHQTCDSVSPFIGAACTVKEIVCPIIGDHIRSGGDPHIVPYHPVPGIFEETVHIGRSEDL